MNFAKAVRRILHGNTKQSQSHRWTVAGLRHRKTTDYSDALLADMKADLTDTEDSHDKKMGVYGGLMLFVAVLLGIYIQMIAWGLTQ